METIVSTLVGGMLAIVGTLVGSYAGQRRERQRWRRDVQLQISTDAMSALQVLIRAAADLAYSDLPPRQTRRVDTPRHRELRRSFDQAVTGWNAAMYAVLVGGDEVLGAAVRELDREADRLMESAMFHAWHEGGFREERRRLGEAMAHFVDLAPRPGGPAAPWARNDLDVG